MVRRHDTSSYLIHERCCEPTQLFWKIKLLSNISNSFQYIERSNNIVLDLETTKTTQAMEIESLKRKVKKLEKKQRLRTHKLKRPYKVGLTARVESSDDNEDLVKDASKQGRI
nr:hypothetical protein [Tanacetum cinerariifolium]